MGVIVSPIAIPGVSFSALLFDARQVRFIEPTSGIVHYTDGSTQLFSNNSGAAGGASSFVPSANAGNVVPNPGDWLLSIRPQYDPAPPVAGGSAQPGQESASQQFQVPGYPVAPFGSAYYYTNAQFQANFAIDYTNGLRVNQIAP